MARSDIHECDVRGIILEVLMETVYTLTIFAVLIGVIAIPYWLKAAKERKRAEERLDKSQRAGGLMPVTLHPHIDVSSCIGCGSCVKACPEDVLGLAGGVVSVVSGMRCIGHGLCAEVCPVGAIELRFGTPKEGQEIPWYDDQYQTNVKGIYVVGEMGGIGLIRNAVSQALKAVDHIVSTNRRAQGGAEYDVVIVGAGPAGLTASLAAQAKGLKAVALEQDSIGGTIFHYPRQKMVLTNPVELPLYGTIDATEIRKEELLSIWQSIVKKYSLPILIGKKIEGIEPSNGSFVVRTGAEQWKARNVILALGRRGSPRKLGVPGEELPKVAYRLQEAESYREQNIMVVGGGDSAVEAAVALARQPGNTVSISYRREVFVRLKDKNEKNVTIMIKAGKIKALMSSNVSEIRAKEILMKVEEKTTTNLQNDFVFIFAGGEAPTELPRKAGIQFRTS